MNNEPKPAPIEDDDPETVFRPVRPRSPWQVPIQAPRMVPEDRR